MTETPTHDVLIVTGMSGAGRSTVANALEDLGWYVVDNLPPQMLRPLLDLTGLAGESLPRIAVVVDVRGRDLFSELPRAVQALRERSKLRVLFLDAADDVLVRRFEAVRRPHPLQGDGTLLDGILDLPGDVAALRAAVRALDDATLPPLLRRAAAAAAITVGREGMDPPTRDDLQRSAAPKESA